MHAHNFCFFVFWLSVATGPRFCQFICCQMKPTTAYPVQLHYTSILHRKCTCGGPPRTINCETSFVTWASISWCEHHHPAPSCDVSDVVRPTGSLSFLKSTCWTQNVKWADSFVNLTLVCWHPYCSYYVTTLSWACSVRLGPLWWDTMIWSFPGCLQFTVCEGLKRLWAMSMSAAWSFLLNWTAESDKLKRSLTSPYSAQEHICMPVSSSRLCSANDEVCAGSAQIQSIFDHSRFPYIVQ